MPGIAVSNYGKYSIAGDTPTAVDASGNVQVSLASTIDSSLDSIDVDKMSKGSVTTAHSGITASVAEGSCSEIDMRGHSGGHVDLEITAGAGTWTVELYGCPTSGGTFSPQYDENGNQIQVTGVDSSRGWAWPKILANYIKLVPTETGDGATINIKFTPVV